MPRIKDFLNLLLAPFFLYSINLNEPNMSEKNIRDKSESLGVKKAQFESWTCVFPLIHLQNPLFMGFLNQGELKVPPWLSYYLVYYFDETMLQYLTLKN